MESFRPLKRDRPSTPKDTLHSKRHHSSPEGDEDSTTKPVRFLIISDTHDAILSSIPECDVLLHCGDITEDGSPESIQAALNALSNIRCPLKLVIPGNHEISLDKSYYLSQGGSPTAHSEATSHIASHPTIRVLDEGTHTFTLPSGASFTLYASPWTPQHGSSAFQYPSCQDRFNGSDSTPSWATNVASETSRIPQGVDIVMTHGPPKYILDDTGDGRSAGCEHLRRAIARTRPRLHCFGHVHRGYGAQKIIYDDYQGRKMVGGEEGGDCIVALAKEWVGKNQARRKGYASLSPGSAEAFRRERGQTLMVNAAVMDDEGEATNAPWVVELDLKVTKGEGSGGGECGSIDRVQVDSEVKRC